MIRFILQHPFAFIAALLLHLGIIGLFLWQTEAEKPVVIQQSQAVKPLKATVHTPQQTQKSPALDKPMHTFTVDKHLVQQQIARIQKEQAEKLAKQKALIAQAEKERKRLAELKKRQQLEKRKAEQARKKALEEKRKLALAKQKALEQKKRTEEARRKALEAKRLAELEKKRAEALKRKAAEAKRKAELAAKQREKAKQEAQRLLAEAQKKRALEEAKRKALEAEIKRKAEEKKKLEQAAILARLQQEQAAEEAALQRQMEEEAAKRRAAQREKQLKKLREAYISAIRAKVQESWRTAAKISDKAQCDLYITQTPTGNVSSVKVENCNRYASPQFKKAAKDAVYRAQPLPLPPEKELFERNIRFVFKP